MYYYRWLTLFVRVNPERCIKNQSHLLAVTHGSFPRDFAFNPRQRAGVSRHRLELAAATSVPELPHT